MMPTGISVAPPMDLAMLSHIIRYIEPNRADAGISRRWSGPMMSRVMCGIIKPTKPIRPLMETAAAVMTEPSARRIFFVLSVFTPKCCAVSSPREIMFRSRA